MLAVLLALVEALTLHLWLGRVLALALLPLWLVWGNARFGQYLRVHESVWLLLAATMTALYLVLRTAMPLWLTAAAFVVIAIPLLHRGYTTPAAGSQASARSA